MHFRINIKFKLVLTIVTLYCIVHSLILYSPTFGLDRPFLPKNLQVRHKFKLIDLRTNLKMKVFTDQEGVGVFASRKCGGCFVTNNRRFIPREYYDAVLYFYEDLAKASFRRNSSVILKPSDKLSDKTFALTASRICLGEKLMFCEKEPRIDRIKFSEGGDFISEDNNYNMCSFCDSLYSR